MQCAKASCADFWAPLAPPPMPPGPSRCWQAWIAELKWGLLWILAPITKWPLDGSGNFVTPFFRIHCANCATPACPAPDEAPVPAWPDGVSGEELPEPHAPS